MNRADFQRIAHIRISEATTLLATGSWHGAYYLAGYAIECGLKACIAKKTREYDFPDKKVVNASYSHDLESLVGVAGLTAVLKAQIAVDPDFAASWMTIKDWSEEARYVEQTEQAARNLVEAVNDPQKGVLKWLEGHW